MDVNDTLEWHKVKTNFLAEQDVNAKTYRLDSTEVYPEERLKELYVRQKVYLDLKMIWYGLSVLYLVWTES